MKLISINASQPRSVETPRGPIVTSIFKLPLEGRVEVRGYNIVGDRQSDLTVHGGPSKAIYAYAFDHYAYWRQTLPDAPLSPGNFGENLTTEGLLEEAVHIGDKFRVGTVLLRVTQPRMPCFKLNLRFDRPDMVKLFWRSNRSGVYFAIEEEGHMQAGDELTLVEAHPLKVSIADVVSMYKGETSDPDLFKRVLQSPLRGSWMDRIRELHAEHSN